jgi:hypothetical protein
MIVEPGICKSEISEPFMAPYATADHRICKRQIVDLAVKTNEEMEDGWVLVSSGCQLENDD